MSKIIDQMAKELETKNGATWWGVDDLIKYITGYTSKSIHYDSNYFTFKLNGEFTLEELEALFIAGNIYRRKMDDHS